MRVTYPRMVYAIVHCRTKRIYVGSTSHLPRRIEDHFSALSSHRHSNSLMQQDHDLHDCFFEVYYLDTISNSKENYKEYLWMDKLNTRNPKFGYNYKDTFHINLKIKPYEKPYDYIRHKKFVLFQIRDERRYEIHKRAWVPVITIDAGRGGGCTWLKK